MKNALRIFLLLLPLISSCSQTHDKNDNTVSKFEPTASMKANHVVTHTIEYYTSSPAQARSAEGELPAGTEVQIIDQMGSYVLVRTTNNIEAYIASSAIK